MKTQGDRIRELFKSASEEVIVIAPFIKMGALESLLEVIPHHVFIRCVTRWLPKDIAQGVSDPEILNLLERRGRFTLSLVDNLHAKLYVSGNKCLAGSANITNSGLGDSVKESNIEILIETGIDNPNVIETLEAISRTERKATRLAAETARRLADSFRPLIFPNLENSSIWFPRSRKSERAFEFYKKPPTGYLSATDQFLLADIASANIQPGLTEADFGSEIKSLLKEIPIAKALLSSNNDMLLTKADALPYIALMAGPEFSKDDFWNAFVNWMSYFFSDILIEQEITEVALRRAQML